MNCHSLVDLSFCFFLKKNLNIIIFFLAVKVVILTVENTRKT